jgi:hypothetical protein
MTFEQILFFGFWALVLLALLGGLLRFRKTLRQRLFPDDTSASQGEAMAEFLVLQARLKADNQEPKESEGKMEEE